MFNYTLQDIGDYLQFINPVAGLMIAAHQDRAIHYTANYAQTMLWVGLSKEYGRMTKPRYCRRPCDHANFKGMPSGHTASAWTAASYVRTHKDWRWSVPLYGTAVLTAYSRVKYKKHSVIQVTIAAILSEAVVYANKNWKIHVTDDGFNVIYLL